MESLDNACQISVHAMQRFKERWDLLMGENLEDSDVVPRLQEIINGAKPELEDIFLRERKQKHGNAENQRYMAYGPWRLIFIGDLLITVELRTAHGSFSRPILCEGEAHPRFFLRITEGDGPTLVEKSVFKDFKTGLETLDFKNKPEINAIIRFLRLIGTDVAYKRVGTENQKQAILRILLPREFRQFEISGVGERIIRIFFPAKGRYYVFGVTLEDYQRIINFITEQPWLQNVQKIRDMGSLNWQKYAKKMEKIREQRAADAIKRPISELLALSENNEIVVKELLKDYGKQIRKNECKLGKTWVFRYRLAVEGIDISIVIRDTRSYKEGKRTAFNHLVYRLREELSLRRYKTKPRVF